MAMECTLCGYIYDEKSPTWEELPADWVCPICGASKEAFIPVEG
jgi:rubredoxin